MNENHQEKIFRAMAKPEFYPHPVLRIEQRETHISKVFLTGSFVYKIKKPLDLEFLDYTSLAKRYYYCRQETILNRRLSYNIYLGVVPITLKNGCYYLSGPGEPVEYAVKMRQLSEERCMHRLLRKGKIDKTAIEDLAKVLVLFYSRTHDAKSLNTFGLWETIQGEFEENFSQTERFAGELIDKGRFQTIRAACRFFLNRCKALFHHRVETQKIRDCHGDLRSGHIYFADGIQIIDCIEFNERFRYSDVASDLAFLAMDLDFEGFPGAARDLINAYVKYAHDTDVFVLLDLYKCYRALVRAKVNCLRLEHGCLGASGKSKLRSEITRYLDLALQYAVQFNRSTLWIVCGLPASGKSTVSDQLSGILFIKVLRSDLIRKELFGPIIPAAITPPFEEGIYSKEATSQTYGRLFSLARKEIESGTSVIIDATFSSKYLRLEAMALAQDLNANIIFIECTSPENIIKERLLKRETEASISDARLYLFEQFKERFEPFNEGPEKMRIRIDTQRPLDESIQQILSGARP